MEIIENLPNENIKLLKEIANTRTQLLDLYTQHGPASPDYISLSLKQNLLINQYIEEKIASMV
ncbi:aspartyl-phosphate phosphatase Spo0E family protein [Neobacillus dielmonensis]|uniref:aspartyl-phosphate phosphatase Spo0E family protein n=1 Tax=Neobacillus dielmonensis TaxID=1347369 RepID=UPI0005A66200|nr:aspartyl-phosphate phosphatase Spo0E family protein [Neobacillus dielmonensis]